MSTISQVQKQFEQRFNSSKALAVGGLFVAALLVAPLTYLILKGILGLVAVAVAFIVGSAILGSIPVASMKFANWRLSALKKEAGRNPIETLQNLLATKRTALREFLESITSFESRVVEYRNKVEKFSREHPEEAPKFRNQLSTMESLLSSRKDKLRRADAALDKFEQEIEKADAVWQMSQAALAMSQAAGMQTGDPFERIKAETAVNAVEHSMNTAFAQLEQAMLEEELDAPRQIEKKESLLSSQTTVNHTKEKVRT
jgi:hypothetical protein